MPGLEAVCAALAVAALAWLPNRALAVSVALALGLLATYFCVRARRLMTVAEHAATKQVAWNREGRESLGRQVQEHRRYHRHLAVLRMPPGSGGPAELITRLYPRLRVGTSVWLDGTDVLIISPSTDRADASGMVARLSAELSLPDLSRQCVVAVFPDDALTTGALMELASSKAMQAQIADTPGTSASTHTVRYVAEQPAADPVDQSAS